MAYSSSWIFEKQSQLDRPSDEFINDSAPECRHVASVNIAYKLIARSNVSFWIYLTDSVAIRTNPNDKIEEPGRDEEVAGSTEGDGRGHLFEKHGIRV